MTTVWRPRIVPRIYSTGPRGASGSAGPAGPGVAAGGTTGQVLAKASAADYDTQWVTASGGGAYAAASRLFYAP